MTFDKWWETGEFSGKELYFKNLLKHIWETAIQEYNNDNNQVNLQVIKAVSQAATVAGKKNIMIHCWETGSRQLFSSLIEAENEFNRQKAEYKKNGKNFDKDLLIVITPIKQPSL